MTSDFSVDMNEYLPLRDVVFNTLRQAILKGELKPGERLLEIALAERLGVSRTPVREAMRKLEQEGLVAGEESEYGLFVKTVDGYTADDSNQEWWCFTKNGESLTTGVDTTPIADGEHFEATLTVGY